MMTVTPKEESNNILKKEHCKHSTNEDYKSVPGPPNRQPTNDTCKEHGIKRTVTLKWDEKRK